MLRLNGKNAVLCAAAVAMFAPIAGAAVVTQWDFQNVDTANATGNSVPTTTPTPTVGIGSAATLGMVNNYATSNTTDASDVFETISVADQGSSDPTPPAQNNIWRVRGTNGWNSAAPQFSQGSQFLVPTTGYTALSLSFDWFPTKRGVDDLQVQYTTDGTTFTNIGSVISAGTSTSGNLNWLNRNTIDFSTVLTANNDANFGVRMVSAYHGTTGAYQDTTGAALNNTSGNWRFDEVTVSGTAVPEPVSASLLGIGAIGLISRRRRAL